MFLVLAEILGVTLMKKLHRLVDRLKEIRPCPECEKLHGMVLLENEHQSVVAYCHCLYGRLLWKLHHFRQSKSKEK